MSDERAQSPAEQAKDAYLALVTRIGGDPEGTVEELRAGYDAFTERCLELPAGARVAPCRVGGVDGLSVIAPAVKGTVTLVHFHGGGYVIGSPHGYRSFAAELSAAAGAEVILPGYRLAPEHAPLDPVDDAVAVVRGLLAEGRDPARLVLSGDSAGGGLALAALIALRDAGDPLPAAAAVFSPWADATLSAASVSENAERDPIVPPAFLSTLALLRLGADEDRRHPLLSPAFADWTGIPPLLLFASQAEVLRDDAITVARRAAEAGVRVRLELYEEMVHVWPVLSRWLPEGRRALAQLGAFVQSHTGPSVGAL